MLSDASYLERVLQWLVTDHKEADDAAGTGGGGLAALLSAQRQPHDVLCAGLRAGSHWPYTPSHGMTGANFSLANAQLFKGLAQRLPPRALHEALLPPLLALAATSSTRDVQATAAEALAGLVRGAGVWPLADHVAGDGVAQRLPPAAPGRHLALQQRSMRPSSKRFSRMI